MPNLKANFTACNKYRNVKTEINGIMFASRKESRRYQDLELMQKAGLIHNLELQKKYELQPKFTTATGEKIRAINYIADFVYVDEAGKIIVEDSKGYETDEFILKKKLFLYKFPEYVFLVS